MAAPQPGIFALGTSSHAYLELDLVPGVTAAGAVARVAALREPHTTIGGVNLFVGFRPALWGSVAPDAAPPAAKITAIVQLSRPMQSMTVASKPRQLS